MGVGTAAPFAAWGHQGGVQAKRTLWGHSSPRVAGRPLLKNFQHRSQQMSVLPAFKVKAPRSCQSTISTALSSSKEATPKFSGAIQAHSPCAMGLQSSTFRLSGTGPTFDFAGTLTA